MEEKRAKERRERKTSHCPPPPGEFPWLVFCHGKYRQNQTFYSISGNSSYARSVPELRNKKVHNSCHGWLILSAYQPNQFSLWNPITFESINLPRLELEPTSEINACVLSLPPGHPDSTIFVFEEGFSSIRFCRLQSQRWSTHCYGEEIKVISDCINDEDRDLVNYLYLPVSCNGKVYATTSQGDTLISIDIIEPDSIVLRRLARFPELGKQISSRGRHDLVESNGDILSIITLYEDKDEEFHLLPERIMYVEIHKLDLGSMAWERLLNVKDRAFFLDYWYYQRSWSVSCSEALGNRVYFLQKFDNWLYSYHLEDCTVSTSLPCPNLPTPRMGPIWVMPHRLAGSGGEAIPEEEETIEERNNEDQATEKEETEARGTQLLNLPLDVLKYIHDRLTLLDYMSFRSVSRLAREAISPLQMRTAISRSEIQGNTLSPWLMYAHKNGRICRFTHPQSSDRYVVEVPEPLQDALIWYCKDGWLLIGKERDDNFCLNFFNPFTNDVIPYPELKGICVSDTRIGFSSPPTCPDCVIVVLVAFKVHVCHSRTTGWCLLELNDRGDFWITNNYPVFANGAFYFLGSEGNLGVVRLQGEGCGWEILDQPQKLHASYNEGFLAERDGEIYVVLTYGMGKQVRVLKLDHSTLSWKRVRDLGKYNLHVSKSSALFTAAKTSEAENMIYFPRFCREHLVSYSLSTNSLVLSGTRGSMKNYDGTIEPLTSCWIKPSWS